MSLFIPITKVDVAKRLVYGTISEEVPDKAGEILDYESAKPAFQEWSDQFRSASGGKSLGNVRAMHGAVAAGKLTDIEYDDENKRIGGVAKIVDDDEWEKVLEGVYTGFSIGGGYARRWPDMENPQLMRYTPTLSEVSLVDNPAVPTATFEVVKQDGSKELRKFNLKQKAVAMSRNQDDNFDDDDNGDDASHAAELLDQLGWLKDMLEEQQDDEMLAHVEAIEDYLTGEDDEESDDEEPGDGGEDDAGDWDDDDDTSSHAYAAELARASRRLEIRKRARSSVASALPEMKSLIADLQKRLAQLEAQPLPPKGVLRVISKSDDRAQAAEALAQLSPAERARELMKIALSNPVEM